MANSQQNFIQLVSIKEDKNMNYNELKSYATNNNMTIFNAIYEKRHDLDRDVLDNITEELVSIINGLTDGSFDLQEAQTMFYGYYERIHESNADEKFQQIGPAQTIKSTDTWDTMAQDLQPNEFIYKGKKYMIASLYDNMSEQSTCYDINAIFKCIMVDDGWMEREEYKFIHYFYGDGCDNEDTIKIAKKYIDLEEAKETK